MLANVIYLSMNKKKFLNENFGPYVRRLRKEQNIGQRDLAKKIGIDNLTILLIEALSGIFII